MTRALLAPHAARSFVGRRGSSARCVEPAPGGGVFSASRARPTGRAKGRACSYGVKPATSGRLLQFPRCALQGQRGLVIRSRGGALHFPCTPPVLQADHQSRRPLHRCALQGRPAVEVNR